MVYVSQFAHAVVRIKHVLPSIDANVNRVSVYVVKALKVIVLEETKRSGRVTISFEDEVAVLEARESNESQRIRKQRIA